MIYWLTSRFFWFVVWVFFRLKISGREFLPKEGAAVIAMNHASFFDPMIGSVLSLERQMHWVARSSLNEHWLYRFLASPYAIIHIRRGEPDLSALRSVIEELQQGHMVMLFPEETRSPDGTIQPLKSGFHLAARRAKVPVIPVHITGSYEAWSRHDKIPRFFSGARIRVNIGPAIDVSKLKQAEANARVLKAWEELATPPQKAAVASPK